MRECVFFIEPGLGLMSKKVPRRFECKVLDLVLTVHTAHRHAQAHAHLTRMCT